MDLNRIQDALLTDGVGMAKRPALLLKSVTHPAMMKLGTSIPYLKKTQRIYELRDTPPWVLLTAFFHPKSANIAISRNADLDCILVHISNSFTFFESLKTVLINIVTVLMMSPKMAIVGLLKIKVFWNKGYDVIISVHDVTNKILSSGSNYIVDVVMWRKFGNSAFLWEKLS